MLRRQLRFSSSLVSPSASICSSRLTTPFPVFAQRFATGGSNSGNNNNTGISGNPSSSTVAASASAAATAAGGGFPAKQRYSDDEIRAVVKALESDPELAVRIVSSMSPAARRQLVVAGSAFEWFGGQGAAQTEVTAADVDKDTVISSKDFDVWFVKALERRHQKLEREKQRTAEAGDAEKAAAATAAATPVKALTLGCLVLIGLEAGLPFVGFGFLDNAVMILSGDAIDRSVGFYLGCSVMASAAMGNVVSGMLGMQIHGSIERLVHFLKLPVPALDEEQRKSRKVFLAGHMGGTIGIAIGLAMGMLPLLFISDHNEKRSFDELDKNKDDVIDQAELRSALRKAGVEAEISEEVATNLMKKYGDGSKLTPAQFHKLCVDLKVHGPVALTAMKMVSEA